MQMLRYTLADTAAMAANKASVQLNEYGKQVCSAVSGSQKRHQTQPSIPVTAIDGKHLIQKTSRLSGNTVRRNDHG